MLRALLVRFFRSGGGPMLKMMGGSPAHPAHDDPKRHTRGETQPAYPWQGHDKRASRTDQPDTTSRGADSPDSSPGFVESGKIVPTVQ